ncbi:MAG: FGGY-family carbohydrate kinase [Phycisphaeraceae bacterium]
MACLGLDIGTTVCKAVAFDADGAVLAQAHREYPLHHPAPAQAELDSDEVTARCFEVIAEAAGAAGEPVRAIGVASQGEAFVAMDGQDRPLCRAMVSSDTRAAGLIGPWVGNFGQDRLYRITGHTAHPMFSLFKLLWLREHRPELWARTRRVLCLEDLLHLRLGLEPAMSWPLAGRTMLFDVTRHAWSRPILNELTLDAGCLARPLASGEVVGELSRAVAEPLGLAPGALVVAGGHDQPCGALGAGVVDPGVAMYATGTVECICPALPRLRFSDQLREANLATYDFTVPGMATTVAFSLAGGNLLQWYRDRFGTAEVAEAERRGVSAYQVLLERMPTEPTSLLTLPYFTASGTPYFDTDTPGAVVGLRLTTSAGEVLRGLLEGVALEMRLNLELMAGSGIDVGELRVIGGGARSERWMQLKADVLGRPLATVSVTEAGCLGSAVLATSAATGEPVRTLARRWVTPGRPFEPDPAWAAAYKEKFEAYRALYPAVCGVTRRVAASARSAK